MHLFDSPGLIISHDLLRHRSAKDGKKLYLIVLWLVKSISGSGLSLKLFARWRAGALHSLNRATWRALLRQIDAKNGLIGSKNYKIHIFIDVNANRREWFGEKRLVRSLFEEATF